MGLEVAETGSFPNFPRKSGLFGRGLAGPNLDSQPQGEMHNWPAKGLFVLDLIGAFWAKLPFHGDVRRFDRPNPGLQHSGRN